MAEYGLVAVKRSWCPEWLYAVMAKVCPELMLRRPLRGIFHRELNWREQQGLSRIPEIRNETGRR